MRKIILILISTLLVFGMNADEKNDKMVEKEVIPASILAGEWLQTASTAGDCEDCILSVKQLTPHIFYLNSSNGWVGSVWYKNDGYYTGFMELTKKNEDGNDWSNEIFQLVLSYDGLTLTLKAASEEHHFIATFWEK